MPLISIFRLLLFLFRPDVYFVTMTQALSWVSDPKPLKQLPTYEPWDCKKYVPPTSRPCNLPNKCALGLKRSNMSDIRYMDTCRDCPNKYPWLGDAEGSGIPGRDNYIYTSEKDIVPEGQK